MPPPLWRAAGGARGVRVGRPGYAAVRFGCRRAHRGRRAAGRAGFPAWTIFAPSSRRWRRGFRPPAMRGCTRSVHRLDFRREPGLERLFADSLDPRTVLSNLELHVDAGIDVERDLVFFDEVGECQPAVARSSTSRRPCPRRSCARRARTSAFPVGKVRQLEMFPLCFEEFLMAAGRPRLLQAFLERRRGEAVHQPLWSLLLDYYFVGGMPEAVAHWFEAEGGLRERAEGVARIHRELMAGYRRDFGKYAGKLHAQHIDAVFSNVPRQLAASETARCSASGSGTRSNASGATASCAAPSTGWRRRSWFASAIPSRAGRACRYGRRRGRTSSSCTCSTWGCSGTCSASPTRISARRTSPSRATSPRTSSRPS